MLFNARSFFVGAPADVFAAALGNTGVHDGVLPTPFHSLVIRAPGEIVLVDTGMGPSGGPDAGHLLVHLRAAGIAPDDVGCVVISHAHLDHVGGVLDAAGHLAFPNARYVLSAEEWTFWHGAEVDRIVAHVQIQRIRQLLAQIGSRVVPVSEHDSVVPGVTVRDLPGHTPGQIGLQLESEGARMLYVADVVAHPLHFTHPEWHIVADVDPALAIRTRRAVLSAAAADQTPLYVYHHPARPPIYYAVQDGTAWQAVPAG